MFTEPVQSRADQAAATRQRVLDAAEERFRTSGFEASTIRQIAEDAGVSVGTVMGVGDKDALLIAVFDGWIEAVHTSRTVDGVPASSDGSVVGDVFLIIEPFFSYFASDRDLARHYAAIITRGKHDSRIFQNLGTALVGEICIALERHGLTSDQALRGAKAIYFGYLGLLMMSSNGAIDEMSAIREFNDIIEVAVSSGRPEPE